MADNNNIPDLLKNTVAGNEILDLISHRVRTKVSESLLEGKHKEAYDTINNWNKKNPTNPITADDISFSKLYQLFSKKHRIGANRLEEQPSPAKSIDDIIRESDIIEAIAPKDATNVEAGGRPIRQMLPGRTDMETMFDLFYPPSDEEQMMNLRRILEDLARPKPLDT